MLCSFRELVLEVMEGMTLPDSADMSDRRRQTFLGWLAATPGCKEGNPDQTYWIVESLLGISYETSKAEEGQASSSVPPWRNSQVAAMGSMKVIRVSNVQVAGMHFVDMLKSFMKETQHPHSGPAWSGEAKALHGQPSVDWQLFAVIKDFSQNETHSLYQNVDGWFCQKPLCCSHPAWQKSSQASPAFFIHMQRQTLHAHTFVSNMPC